eukprot:scaffold14854_cov129-Isochrysis_galbana.AAC.4
MGARRASRQQSKRSRAASHHFNREEAGAHHEETDAERPNVHKKAIVWHARQHLGRRIALSTAAAREPDRCEGAVAKGLVHVGKSKVADLDDTVGFVEQQVLQLEVPVRHTVLVHEDDSGHHASPELTSPVLAELANSLNLLEKLAPRARLHHDKVLAMLEAVLQEAADIRVARRSDFPQRRHLHRRAT